MFTEDQLASLRNMLIHYREFQEELYNYPEPHTLFTETQREIFDLMDV